MDKNQLVVDLSSDEEENGFKDGDGTDYFVWLNKFLVDDESANGGDGNDSDDVVVVGGVIATPKRRKRKSISVEDVDDDCVVLERKSDEEKDCDDGSDELVIVGEKGQVACRDYPHSRDQCVKFPFKSTQHESHCDLCHCYVCDCPAPCSYWETGTSATDHCHATDKIEFWKLERKRMRMEKNAPAPVPKLTQASFSAHLVQQPQSTACNLSSARIACTGSLYFPPQFRSPSPPVPSCSISRTQSLPPPIPESFNAFAYPMPVCRSQPYPQHSRTSASVNTHESLVTQTAPPPKSLFPQLPSPYSHPQAAYLARPNTFASTVHPLQSPSQAPYSPSVFAAHHLYRSTFHRTRLTDNSSFHNDFQTASLTGNLNSSFGISNIISSGPRPYQPYPDLNACNNNFFQAERGSSLGPCTHASGRAYKIPRVCGGASGADPSVVNQSEHSSFSFSQQQLNLQQAAQPPRAIPYRQLETTCHENLEMLLRQASSLLDLDQTVTEPAELSQLQQYDPSISQESGTGSLYDPSQMHFSVAASTAPSYASSDLLTDPTKTSQESQAGHFELEGLPLTGAIVETELLPLDEEPPAYPYVMSPNLGGYMDCPRSEGFGFNNWIPENSSASPDAVFLSGIYPASSEPAT